MMNIRFSPTAEKFEYLSETETNIAREIMRSLHGLELSRAIHVLDACKEVCCALSIVTVKKPTLPEA